MHRAKRDENSGEGSGIMQRTQSGVKYFQMGDGPEAVICHPSLGLGRFLFYRLIPPLARRYRVMVLDPRGIGENARFEPTLENWVNDVGDLLTEAARPTHLVGVSLGTWVMARAQIRWPEAVHRLVLMSTTPGFADGLAAVEARRKQLAEATMESFARQYAADTLREHTDREILEQLVADMRTVDPGQYLQAMEAIYGTDNREVFRQVTAETLIVAGSNDTRTPPRMADQAAALIPASQVRILPDAGHLVLLDQPRRVEALVLRFLADGRLED